MNQTWDLCQISRVFPSEPRAARVLPVFRLPLSLSPLALMLALSLLACSSGTSAACPSEYPMTCPAPAPSFASDVDPLIQAHCAYCHGPGQQIPRLDSLEQFSMPLTRQKAFFQIQHCSMPPAPHPPLTAAERNTILSWIVCDAMNN